MLANDSQELPSEGNDNEFLPSHSHSYESMIKEHQERRSLILNDQLILPSGLSSEQVEHSRQGRFDQDEEGTLQGESGTGQTELGQREIEQDQENQFLVNENSLVASIKEAMRSNQSKIPSNSSQQRQILEEPLSNENLFATKSNNQMQQNSIYKSANDDPFEEEHGLGGHSGNFNVMDSNIQSKQQTIHQEPEAEISRNSVESDPFQNARSHNQFSNEQNENFAQQSTLKNPQRGFNNFEESNEHELNGQVDSAKSQSDENFLVNHSFSKQQQNNSEFEKMARSRSQIEGLDSGLDPSIKSIQNSISQDIPINPQEAASNQNSLSNLMRYNYFQKAYHQFSQKVESEEIPSSNNLLQSDVKVFRQQVKIQQKIQSYDIINQSRLKQSQEIPRSSEIRLNNPTAEQIDHILMTYESKNNQESGSGPKEQSIIDNINNFSQNSHKFPQQLSLQPSNNSKEAQFIGEHSKNEMISLEELERISKEHHQQIKELDMNHSQLHSSKHFSSNSQEYFNEFNQNQAYNQVNRQHFDMNNENSHQKSQDNQEQFENYGQNMLQPERNSRKSEKESSLKHQKDVSMPSIQPPQRQVYSKVDDYEHQSSKNHKKQHSMIERSSRNPSDMHLPEIDTKNKRTSEIIKKSSVSKKTPSIKMANQSKISFENSRIEAHSKKNSSKIDKNTRDKVASYSQGMQIDSTEQKSHNYRQVQIGSTTLDSKSIIMKKKEDSARQIFNTIPEAINIIDSDPPEPQNKMINLSKSKVALIIDSTPKEKEISLRSPTKQRQDQIERIKVLKQAQRKRLQRQLQKVKKELQQINTREKDMDRIFEQKQKIELKEKQRLVNSRENDFPNKVTRHHRQNEALLNIIKEHRKSKEANQQTGENFQQNIAKNLIQLNQIRKEAEEKMKEKKRLDIIDRMKKNEMRKLNEQKLIKANNQYIQQFRSVDNAVLSPQSHPQNNSKEKGLASSKKVQKDLANANKISKFILQDKRKIGNFTYQEKLD